MRVQISKHKVTPAFSYLYKDLFALVFQKKILNAFEKRTAFETAAKVNQKYSCTAMEFDISDAHQNSLT